MKKLGLILISALVLIVTASTVQASSNTILFILDVSGSMTGGLDGGTKIDAAKRTFTQLVDELPGRGLDVGLEVYGHYGVRDCSAIEVIVPPGPLDPSAVKAKVESLNPDKGATPIADALATAGEVLRGVREKKTIVLISDGEETCGGNPVQTVERLRKEGVDVTVHVVGFGVSDKERAQLEAIARAGGGNYYQADDAGALAESLKKIRKKVALAKSKILVKDGFNEDHLSENWEIKNPNPDSIIVEEGFLQILTALPKDNLLEPTNLVLLKKGLPKQWEAILRLRYTSYDSYGKWYGRPVAGIMLYRDKSNGIILAVAQVAGYGGDATDEAVYFQKVRNNNWVPGFYAGTGSHEEEHEVVLRLQRIKRKFIASFLNEKGKWQKIGEFTELRPKYRIGIFALRGSGDAREALEKFDEFTLKELE